MRISDYANNRLNVLKAIRRSGPLARTELQVLTGLASGTITQLVGELLTHGLVSETKQRAPGRGRPRQNLDINADGGFVVGASLAGPGEVLVNIVDLAGNPKAAKTFHARMGHTVPDFAIAIGGAIKELIETTPQLAGGLKRAGLAIPGVVDSVAGTVHFIATFPKGDPIPVAQIISNEINLPVTIENDTTCMARAEHWFGRATDLESFTLIHVGFALGSAIYADGLPLAQSGGLNCEFGHMKVAVGDDARACFCGGKGCLSAYSSMYGILDHAGATKGLAFPPVTSLPHLFERFMDRVGEGERSEVSVIAEAAALLGTALANQITFNDPGNVVLAFDDPRFLAAMEGPIRQALERHAMPSHLAKTRLHMIVADQDWRAKGTAALALEQAYLRD